MSSRRWMWYAVALLSVLAAACGSASSGDARKPDAAAAAPQPGSAVATGDWQTQWQNALAGAKAEGRLILNTHINTGFTPFVKAFQDSHPEIQVEHTAVNVADFAPRVITEQRNGQFLWDITVSPSSNHANVMGPAGVFQPLPPFYILPEATDTSKWALGFEMYAQNVTNQPLSLVYMAVQSGGVAVNRDVVAENEVRTADDLLDPRWKGKIVIDDPSVPRLGSLSLTAFLREKGEDFVRRLLVEQEPVFTNNPRVGMEWWATGRYPLVIAERTDISSQFREQGLIRRSNRVGPFYLATWAVSVFRNAPHPNATKVFLNWFLSREGQQAYVDAFGLDQGVSRRLDVPPQDLDSYPDWTKIDSYAFPNTERDKDLVDKVIELYKQSRR